MNRTTVVLLLMVLVSTISWTEARSAQAEDGAFFKVKGDKVYDPQGRQVLLHGVNIVDKNPTMQHWQNVEYFAAMADAGVNCIRLGFTWAALEPEPGKYSQAALEEIDHRIALARKNGIYVFLDMHQDLYSSLYADGAPSWATLTEGKPHVQPPGVWSNAYFGSPAIQTAFDNFWANTPGPDGVGIQDRFAMLWKLLAERYKEETTVIGYDLLNEPFSGSSAPETQMIMMGKWAEMIAQKHGGQVMSVPEVQEVWSDTSKRHTFIGMTDIDMYTQSIDSVASRCQEFERTKLVPMYQRVSDAIRSVDRNHILFLGTYYMSNLGIPSGIEPLKGPDGERDPLLIYAPHGYDIGTDPSEQDVYSPERVNFIFSRHGKTQQRLGMPMVVGEWGGILLRTPGMEQARQTLVRKFEELLCGDMYWLFAGDYHAEMLDVIHRPIPMAVSGELLHYQSDPENLAFSCAWKQDPNITAATRIYLPEAYIAEGKKIVLEPAGQSYGVEPIREGSKNVCVVIPSVKESMARKLIVK